MLADLNLEGAQKVAEEINEKYGENRAIAVKMDVTKEEQYKLLMRKPSLAYGGVDIIVNNAGLATSSPFDETSLKEWNLNMNVLGTGYFLVAREAFKIMKQQSIGGNMVFIGSKNSVYAGKNASAYSAAKALEAHLARCIAAEGGEFGIRVNTILPDAILRALRFGTAAGAMSVLPLTASSRINWKSITANVRRCSLTFTRGILRKLLLSSHPPKQIKQQAAC